MTNKKLDPRVLKTRLNLRHALGYLMQKEDLQDISVQKITDTAHITRGTFYLHYKDKQDFVSRVMQEIIDELFDNVMINRPIEEEGKSVSVFSLNKCFTYVENNSDIFTILLDRSHDNNFYQLIYQRLSKEIIQYAKTMNDELDDLDVPVQIQVEFLASALLGLISQWLTSGMIYTARYMTQSLEKMINTFQGDGLFITSFFDTTVQPKIEL